MDFFWLFRRDPVKDAADLLFRQIVAQARSPWFFEKAQVPDTLDGRFELIALHTTLVMWRMKPDLQRLARLSQALFDALFADMDRSLRAMGVDDLSVGKRVMTMVRSFYGCVQAYDGGLAAGPEKMKKALAKNLYATVKEPVLGAVLDRMEGYVRQTANSLSQQTTEALLAGKVVFLPPPAETQGQDAQGQDVQGQDPKQGE